MYRFEDYDLIIDARSEREYAVDHIPGAINLPVVSNDEYAEVGTLHRTDKMQAYLIGVSYSLKNIWFVSKKCGLTGAREVCQVHDRARFLWLGTCGSHRLF
uniref:rhodanese-like domain-containing protein n=1 Tax=Paraburkholderia aspalathi TaxID=1324617 RepID=UPI0022794912